MRGLCVRQLPLHMNGEDVHGGSVAAKLSDQLVESHGCSFACARVLHQAVRLCLEGAVSRPYDRRYVSTASTRR